MSSKNSQTSRIVFFAAVCLLLLAKPASATIEVIDDSPGPFTITGSGNHYQYNLAVPFDLSNAKYPLTIKADGLGSDDPKTPGPGYTYQDVSSTVTPTQKSFESVLSLHIVNHNNLILSGSKKGAKHAVLDMYRCGSPKSLTNLDCQNESESLPLAAVSPEHVLEATRFDKKSGLYVTAWRKSDPVNPELVILTHKPATPNGANAENKYVKVPLKNKAGVITISNRARIELTDGSMLDPKDDQKVIFVTNVWVFDQTVNNGKDVAHSQIMHQAYISTTYKDKEVTNDIKYVGESKLNDEENQIDATTIGSIYEHEGELFISAQRTGEQGHPCLTRLQEPEDGKFKLSPAGSGKFCSPERGYEFFGISNGNELIQLQINPDSQQMLVFAMFDSSMPEIKAKLSKTVSLGTSLKDTKGIREVISGTDTYSIKIATDQGINDTGSNTITRVLTDGLNAEFVSADEDVDIVINSINIAANKNELKFKILSQPFIYFEDKVFEDKAEKKIDIVISDADTEKGKEPTISISVT